MNKITGYPTPYTVVIQRYNRRTGRPLAPVIRYRGHDYDDAYCAYSEAVAIHAHGAKMIHAPIQRGAHWYTR